MNYSAKAYMRNRNKWGRINTMTAEINNIMEETQDTEQAIFNLFCEMTMGLSSRKKELPITIEESSHWKYKLGIFKGGFCVIYNSRSRARAARINYKIIKIICENKNTIINAVHSKTKKEVLEILIKRLKGFAEGEDTTISQSINKRILMPSRDDNRNRVFRETKIKSITCRMGKGATSLSFTISHKKGNDEDTDNIEDRDLAENMIKEQIYLPCWKVLIKAKKRARKKLIKTTKLLNAIKTDLNPIMVSKEV